MEVQMRKVLFFMLISIDGYFEGPDKDINWHNVDEEFNKFALDQLDSVGTLLFGKVTYEMMASYWTTPDAKSNDPIVAEKMNSLDKIVFSKSLSSAAWQNTKLIKENFVDETTRLKQKPGKDLIIFGSSDLAVTFIENDLIDEYRILINPVVLGGGKPLFKGLHKKLDLQLLKTKIFKSGNVLLYYKPTDKGE